MVSEGRQRLSAEFQLVFRLLKGGLFVGGVALLIILFTVGDLSIRDLFTSALAFLPSGWALIQVNDKKEKID